MGRNKRYIRLAKKLKGRCMNADSCRGVSNCGIKIVKLCDKYLYGDIPIEISLRELYEIIKE